MVGRCLIALLLVLPRAGWCVPSEAEKPIPVQDVTSITLGHSVVALYGPWKFVSGDSPLDGATRQPLWATPGFDDSRWETVDLTPRDGATDPTGGQTGYVPGWTARGHRALWGYGWYRLHVRLRAEPGRQLALDGPNDVDDIYQVFWNGTLLGGFGDFSRYPPVTHNAQPAMFALPQGAAATGAGDAAEAVIAFRVWMDPNTLDDTPDAGGLHTAPLLGDKGTVQAFYRNNWLDLLRGVALEPVQTVMFVLLALVCFSLVLFDRSDRVYLWMGAALLVTGMFAGVVVVGALTQWMSIRGERIFADVIQAPVASVLSVMVWRSWFRFRRPVWLPRVVAGMGVLLCLSQVLGLRIFFAAIPETVNTLFFGVSIALRIAFFLILLAMVAFAIRLRGIEGWLALVPVLLSGVTRFGPELTGMGVYTNWFVFGVALDLSAVTEFTYLAVLALLLLRRVYQSVIEQRRLALDVKQAQEVQQVMLPEASIEIPGFEVECEYIPALEVGGDFFQILPHESDGSVLIVAGDVTGKGLKAGMVVALMIGAIRTAAETSMEPGYVLQALNRRLIGRGDSYATGLAMRIAADGSAELVNAGHLPPYVNGQQMEIEGSLPLGMIAGIDFPSVRFEVAQGDRLTMVSDGILEATDARGNLFGFERIRELLMNAISAAQLAKAAQAFGQEDDISVICITRSGELAGMAA